MNSNEIRTHIRGNNSDPFDTKNTSNISGIGQWHMVSMSRNFNSSLKMYIDGILVDVDTDITGIANQFTTTRDILIGSFFDSYSNQNFNFMSGKLDDISIYNRALSQTEIIGLYQSNNVTILSNTNFTQIAYSPSLCMEKLNNGKLNN